jgi:hypothetical protein
MDAPAWPVGPAGTMPRVVMGCQPVDLPADSSLYEEYGHLLGTIYRL